MNFKKPINENYAATIVKIKSITPVPGFDNLVATNIFGNNTLVSKDTEIGTMGLYFPPECKLSEEFLKNNNLYRKPELNKDNTKKGYFDENGRVRTVKFRGFPSMGIFMGIDCLNYLKKDMALEEGDCFDYVNDHKICEKYFVKKIYSQLSKEEKGKKKLRKISKLIENQFRFHSDTPQLGKVISLVSPYDIISITSKWHGTSVVISNILCKRKLNIIEKILKFLRVNINDVEYSNLFSSRKVVQNDDLNPAKNGFYKENIYIIVNKEVKDLLLPGMTFYGEIVGYLPGGGFIQKDYDYGCDVGTHKFLVYRITYTNSKGNVFEFSAKQVQDFCKENGLMVVHELYYGYAKDLFHEIVVDDNWHSNFLEKLKETYLEKDCPYCDNNVPDEGIVLRVEKNYLQVAKLKSFRFFEKETKDLDKGETNIEDNQEESNERS